MVNSAETALDYVVLDRDDHRHRKKPVVARFVIGPVVVVPAPQPEDSRSVGQVGQAGPHSGKSAHLSVVGPVVVQVERTSTGS